MEKPSQPYVFTGRGNYGDAPSATPEELKAAYEAAPACHHPSRTMPNVALEQLGIEEQSVIKAGSEASGTDFDAELQALLQE